MTNVNVVIGGTVDTSNDHRGAVFPWDFTEHGFCDRAIEDNLAVEGFFYGE